MILVVLDAVADALKFRYEFLQKTGIKHFIEDIEFAGRGNQNPLKRFDYGFSGPVLLIYKMGKFFDEPFRFGAEWNF